MESSSGKDIKYSNMELFKLEQSIQKLKNNMASTESFKNSRISEKSNTEIKA